MFTAGSPSPGNPSLTRFPRPGLPRCRFRLAGRGRRVSASAAMNSPAPQRPRKFLVVVDKTAEAPVALRFATRRAQHTGGRVTLLCVAEPGEFQQWRGVEEI